MTTTAAWGSCHPERSPTTRESHMADLLIDLFDRIAHAVITAFPAQWDDLFDVYDTTD